MITLQKDPARDADASVTSGELADLMPLLRELNDLKRIRYAGSPNSLATELFLRSWERLLNGEELCAVAIEETASAAVATKLGAITGDLLALSGCSESEQGTILGKALAQAASGLDSTWTQRLTEALRPGLTVPRRRAETPTFAQRLAEQPRAGATRPGHRRIILEPAENHADHCAIVAVSGVLCASVYEADPGQVFLTGLSHHLHNAYLPDAGDAGDVLLGEMRTQVCSHFRAQALAELPEPLRQAAERTAACVFRSDTPEARAFQAADVIDRVLEMEWHARVAAFTLDVALHDLDIVHPGPVQAFQQDVLRGVGLWH